MTENFTLQSANTAPNLKWTFIVLFAALVLVFTLSNLGRNNKKVEPPRFAENPFTEIKLEAKSAVVYSPRTGEILYAKDDLSPRPLASIAKLMTAVAAHKILTTDSDIVISREDLLAEGDSGLRSGEKFSLKDLVDLTLISSSNDGAEALASAAAFSVSKDREDFYSTMNKVSHELGLSGVLFTNPSGLDTDALNAGAYGTARDIAKLLAYIVKEEPALISATRYGEITVDSDNGFRHTARNTNTATGAIPGLIGGKTGFTDLSGGNLAIAFDAGMGDPLIIVVLGSSEEGRFEDVKKLVGASLLYIRDHPSKEGVK